MSTVLVTGAAGFIGSSLAPALLDAGHRVVGLDLVTAPNQGAFTDFRIVDLSDRRALADLLDQARPEVVIHAGGASGLMVWREDPPLIIEANLGGTANLLEAARRARVRRVVLCSSVMVYGDQDAGPIGENAPLRPLSVYAATKVGAEALLRAYSIERGLEGIALRIGHVYGPGRRTACHVRTMVEDSLAGRPTVIAEGSRARRQYVHVADVVQALVRAACSPLRTPATFNITAGEMHTLEEVALLAREILGHTQISFGQGEPAADYLTGQLDIAAAARELNWRPRIPLASGLRSYAMALKGAASGERYGGVD
jgi:nucleoside-diphosphate-sugar epimerase